MIWRTAAAHVVLMLEGFELEGRIVHSPGECALTMLLPDGSDEALSVDLVSSGYVAFPGEVFVKDYSEHAGLPAALVEAGVCEPVEEVRVGPFDSPVVRMRVLG